MRPRIAICLLVLTAAALSGVTGPSAESGTSSAGPFDVAGVRAAVNKTHRGPRATDAALSAEPFAEDAIWINAFGRRVVGWNAIEVFLRGLDVDSGCTGAERPAPPEIAEVVFLRADVAVARVFGVTRPAARRRFGHPGVAIPQHHERADQGTGRLEDDEIVTDERDRPKNKPNIITINSRRARANTLSIRAPRYSTGAGDKLARPQPCAQIGRTGLGPPKKCALPPVLRCSCHGPASPWRSRLRPLPSLRPVRTRMRGARSSATIAPGRSRARGRTGPSSRMRAASFTWAPMRASSSMTAPPGA